jgi:hypothetical protein
VQLVEVRQQHVHTTQLLDEQRGVGDQRGRLRVDGCGQPGAPGRGQHRVACFAGRLVQQDVAGEVQVVGALEQCGVEVGRGQVLAGAAVRQHAALPVAVDQHHDAAGRRGVVEGECAPHPRGG